MLGDVLDAARAVGTAMLVSEDEDARRVAAELGAEIADDSPEGQGAAVQSALIPLEPTPVLVVNADVPCVQPRDLFTLLGAVPDGGVAVVPAPDGTTNAIGLATPRLFAPLYGADSARRFRWHVEELGAASAVVRIPNLEDDVDTVADLERLEERLGPRTRAALAELAAAVAR